MQRPFEPVHTPQPGPYAQTTRSITISVEPEFLASHSDPSDHRFIWAYHIHIENKGSQTVQLKSRYWHITDERGQIQEVTGDGVIGEQPVLEPGDVFTYSSGTPLPTASGIMKGYYVMESQTGEVFSVTIPIFSLDSQDLSHKLH